MDNAEHVMIRMQQQPTWEGIPKIIWMMWCDGEARAPDIVATCIASWRRHHPDWQVVVLSRENLAEWLDLPAITGKPVGMYEPVVLADLVRVHVLAALGGVWADATLYCNRPLESWLAPYVGSGFFAFRNPGPDRALSTWFLAARAGNGLILQWSRDVTSYWWRRTFFGNRRFPGLRLKLIARWSTDQHTALRWFRWWVRWGLCMHPYFWLHYHFARMLARSASMRILWAQTPDYPAKIPHVLQFENGLQAPMTKEQGEVIERGEVPVFKLSWKVDVAGGHPSSVLMYLMSREGRGRLVEPGGKNNQIA
jgi:hypothetical protein